MATPIRIATVPSHRVAGRPIPNEGGDGLFTQSWYPICLSGDVAPGQVKGYDFLDGRVVVMRTSDGRASVLSAYCPHMGADLSAGEVVDDTIRCAFHHWQYSDAGACVKTKVGDPPPATACLFRFVSQERFGIVWAFNGVEPHYDLPSFSLPDDELAFKVVELPGHMPIDPWIQCANTPDMQHIRALHGIDFDREISEDEITWTEHSLTYEFSGTTRLGVHQRHSIGIYGTSLYFQESTVQDGKKFGTMVPMGLPRPGFSRNFLVICVPKNSGTPDEIERDLQFFFDLEIGVLSEDIMVISSMHFRSGTLTRSDKAIAKYFDYVRNYPRTHPSRDFIR